MNNIKERENFIDQKYLKEALLLDEESGIFTWKLDRPLEHFKNEQGLNTFNVHFGGKPAGYLFKLPASNTEYIQIRLKNKLYMAHRLVWLYITGKWPNGFIDHLDGNGLNNKIGNLREVNNKENSKNKGMSPRNKSGFNGVYFSKAAKKWIAEGEKKYLGCYVDIEDAINARIAWEQEVGGFTERHGKPLEISL